MDSLVVDLKALGRESFMPLFVVFREGATLDDALKGRIGARIRRDISPRRVPDEIYGPRERVENRVYSASIMVR